MATIDIPKQLTDLLNSFNPDDISRQIIEAGERWSDTDAAASLLEETRKSLLAKLTLQYVEEGVPSSKPGVPPKPMSQTQAEAKALADERYQLHIRQMVDARKEANTARVRYDTGKLKVELLRSLQATLRQEMFMNRSGY